MTQPLFETVYVPHMHVAICHKHGDPDCAEVRIPGAHYHPLGKYLGRLLLSSLHGYYGPFSPSGRHVLNDVSNAPKHCLERVCELPGDQAPERVVGWLEGGSVSVHS